MSDWRARGNGSAPQEVVQLELKLVVLLLAGAEPDMELSVLDQSVDLGVRELPIRKALLLLALLLWHHLRQHARPIPPFSLQ